MPPHAPLHLFLRHLLTSLTVLLLLAPAACGRSKLLGGAPSKEGSADKGEADVLTGTQILRKSGPCTDSREVTEAKEGSDEQIILRVYELALGPDNDETFKAFRDLFPESRNTRQIKEMYWPRIRKNVHKYMIEPGEPGYTICRIMLTNRGRKYFIKTSDSNQHDPPIEVGERGGSKKILAFTPF